MSESRTPWPHAPTHRLSEGGVYFVTASAYQKRHRFRGKERLEVLQRGLLKLPSEYGWRLEAWAVFSNHYHFIAHSSRETGSAESLRVMLSHLHSQMSSWINRLDDAKGRKNWHNYWDTKLTHQQSYLARLNYVHQNPVKHGLVAAANQYPWCSARWFERTASPAMVKSIYRFKTDRINVADDYDPDADWQR